MKISNFKSFFKKKFNVENFNDRFKTIYSGYTGYPGAPGIFLRTDKLGNNMIEDWFKYLNVEYSYEDTMKMNELVRLNWRSQY